MDINEQVYWNQYMYIEIYKCVFCPYKNPTPIKWVNDCG